MHVGDSSIYLNWLLENMYNKVPNSNSGKNYELLLLNIIYVNAKHTFALRS